MAKWSLSPIEGNTLEELRSSLQQHASELSIILGELEQSELQTRGEGGYTATIGGTLDLQRNAIVNARPSRKGNEYITRSEAQQFGLYARTGAHRARGRIEAMAGLSVTRAVDPADALPLAQAHEMVGGVVPSGGIILWSGSTASVPAGWALCNGTSGTPDLRDRFVVGAGSTYAVGGTGGANSINLAHTHSDGTYATDSQGAHTHGVGTLANGTPSATTTVDNDLAASTVAVGSATHTHTITGATDSQGAHTHDVTGASGSSLSSPTDIRPLYYALAYIMKL